MAYIKTIAYEESEGRLREIYDDIIKMRGKLATVHQIQSLNPETIVAHMHLYMKIMFGRSPLKRYQREMMGVVVSVHNRCNYCVTHHALALQHFWKNEEKMKQFIADFTKVGLSDIDVQWCQLAQQLTVQPSKAEEETYLQGLRDLGATDRMILDATLIIAYFNFVNRLVLGLGIKLEEDGGGGFEYE